MINSLEMLHYNTKKNYYDCFHIFWLLLLIFLSILSSTTFLNYGIFLILFVYTTFVYFLFILPLYSCFIERVLSFRWSIPVSGPFFHVYFLWQIFKDLIRIFFPNLPGTGFGILRILLKTLHRVVLLYDFNMISKIMVLFKREWKDKYKWGNSECQKSHQKRFLDLFYLGALG